MAPATRHHSRRAAGDGIRMLGTALAEEVPARLAERAERPELHAA